MMHNNNMRFPALHTEYLTYPPCPREVPINNTVYVLVSVRKYGNHMNNNNNNNNDTITEINTEQVRETRLNRIRHRVRRYNRSPSIISRVQSRNGHIDRVDVTQHVPSLELPCHVAGVASRDPSPRCRVDHRRTPVIGRIAGIGQEERERKQWFG